MFQKLVNYCAIIVFFGGNRKDRVAPFVLA